LSVSPQQRTIDVIVIAMIPAIHRFIEAHDRYLALDDARSGFGSPRERELFHIEIMKAYPEVQYRAQVIAGLQYANGMDFPNCH
jgi:hypothetical protein